MIAVVKEANDGRLKEYFKPEHIAIGAINSQMQCMMKGVYTPSLCKHLDSKTAVEYVVYSCSIQDQELDRIDYPNLNERLRQNTVQNQLYSIWFKYILFKSENKPDQMMSKLS